MQKKFASIVKVRNLTILNINKLVVLFKEYDLLAKVIQQQPNRQDTERYFIAIFTVLLLILHSEKLPI